MTEDRQSVWVRTYKELLAGFVAALGGPERITPTQKATARTIAVLQTELQMLASRFASGGRGASAEDLNQFLKVSATVATLMDSVGLTKQQPPVAVDASADAARAALEGHLVSLLKVAEEDKERDAATGIFHGEDGNPVTNPRELELLKELHALRRGTSTSTESATAEPATKAPPVGLHVVPPIAKPQPPKRRSVPLDSSGKPIPGACITALASPNASFVEARPPPPPDLLEKHNELSRSHADLEKQRGRLCEEVLSNPARRAQLDETTAKLAAVDTELAEIRIKMAAWQAAQSSNTTDSYLEWSGRGGDSRITNWSPQSNPNWDRLR
jgi:hypothetical protein